MCPKESDKKGRKQVIVIYAHCTLCRVNDEGASGGLSPVLISLWESQHRSD